MKVLIVEDESLLAMSYKMALDTGECEVVGIASTAEEAIKCVETYRPDIVLMDIRLKGSMDGIEAAKTIMESSSARIIYITGNTDEETRIRAEKTNPEAYLEKPIDCAALQKMLCASSR